MNASSSTPVAKAPLILCIDDFEVGLRLRKLLLGIEGYKVLTASSGEEGLGIFRRNPVELVISDHFLSGRSGTEIAREMKAMKPQVPILIVSGALEEPEGLEFADGFLAKGEAPEVLLNTIAHLLGRRASKSALTNPQAEFRRIA